jgi:integrase
MLEVRSSGGKTYYQRYTDERGRERQFKIGPADVLSLRQARQRAKQIKAEAILGSDPQRSREERRSIPTLQAFVDERYLPFIRTYKRSWKTDETVLRIHVLPVLGHNFLDEITAHLIVQLAMSMKTADYAPGTVARVVIILRYVFNLARKWGVLRSFENPARSVPIPPDVQRSRYLNDAELSRLVASIHADENTTAAKAILLLLLTGARRNEVTYARWDYIDWTHQTLFVPQSKNGRSRYIRLNSAALELLRSVEPIEGNPYVFPAASTGRPMPHLFFPWDRIRKRAAVTDLRLHDLRHSFASFLVNQGEDLHVVQKLLGHLSARSTQRYAHLSPQRLGKAVEIVASIVRGSGRANS